MTKKDYLALFEENIRNTNYITDYDKLVEELRAHQLGETEIIVLASAVKYLTSQRSYARPDINKNAMKRIDRFWQSHTVDSMISIWGDVNVTSLYRLCGFYNRDYIRYLLNEYPEILYEDTTHSTADIDLKRVCMIKFAPMLYEDYLDMKKNQAQN